MEGNRREESPSDSCAEPSCDAPPPSPVPDASPVVLVFPCTGPEKSYPLTAGQVARWGELFDTVDVPHECRMALAWIEANPVKRKTARGMPKFLTAWLNRAVNDPRKGTGGGVGIQYRRPGPMRPTADHSAERSAPDDLPY